MTLSWWFYQKVSVYIYIYILVHLHQTVQTEYIIANIDGRSHNLEARITTLRAKVKARALGAKASSEHMMLGYVSTTRKSNGRYS